MHALPAGSYMGSVAKIANPGPSPRAYVAREGRLMRDAARNEVMAFAGIRRPTLRGLGSNGDVNLCTDPGWTAVREATGAITSLFGAAASASDDSGWQAAGQAGTALSTSTQTWRNACIQAQMQQSTGASPADIERMLAAQNTQLQNQINAQRAQSEAGLATMLALQQGQRSQGIDTNTLLIGGGILVAVVFGAWALTR